MNFAAVLESVQKHLADHDQPFAVVGGVALAAYGIVRTTLDLDLVVNRSAQDELIDFLETCRYETLFRSTGYSNHLHQDPSKGRVDMIYVGGSTSDAIFAECRRLAGPGGLVIPVARPEHLAAMKIQAMVNDPTRRFRDTEDLRALLARPGVDRLEIRQQFERHGLRDQYDEILKTL